MTDELYKQLSRLERQIMDAVYRLERAPVAEVVSALGTPDASESIRVTMSNLEKKGFLQHEREGVRNVYFPVVPEDEARESVVGNLIDTFFGGSTRSAILGLLERDGAGLTPDEILEIRRMIDSAEAGDDGA